MISIKWRVSRRDYDLGVYPTQQADEFRRWSRAWAPNRHYLFETLAS